MVLFLFQQFYMKSVYFFDQFLIKFLKPLNNIIDYLLREKNFFEDPFFNTLNFGHRALKKNALYIC